MSGGSRAPVEIERKFLVTGDAWQRGARAISIRQGYLARSADCVVRVRIADRAATLTIKGRAHGLTTPEFEYPIPTDHALPLLELCQAAIIEKTRYRVDHEGHSWEVDVFSGANAGLVLAEIELETEDEAFARPAWLGVEVTHDHRFKNSQLCVKPFRDDWLR
ncbi:MAG: CYTH domain-containing protein [Deltaproteobacteria bacterium]|nr:CYTH domain-containing protein [Deltaproteobacteria bacterium]MBW2722855.1 CYTH domain-containing protein [Deltaproteobacteria bacterium]